MTLKVKEFFINKKKSCVKILGITGAAAITGATIAFAAFTGVGMKVAAGEENNSAVSANSSYATATSSDDVIEFDYNGENIVISADTPVKLASMEELSSKIATDTSTVSMGANVPVDDPDSDVSVQTVTEYSSEDHVLRPDYAEPAGNVANAVPGIDVSHWQNDIDWAAVANAGYKFAMIKVAGRSIGDGAELYQDAYFRTNIEGAIKNGIKVGVYFFSQALTVQEAYEEASYILNLIDGYNISYPVAFDWETTDGYRTHDKLNSDELTKICEAFCDTVKSHGYEPMIYLSKNDWINCVDRQTLSSKYSVWLAWYFYKYYYSDENRLYQNGDELPDLDFKYNIWQYTSTGRISGVDGYCDMNVSFTPDFDISGSWGDVNGDGKLSSADAVVLKKYLADYKNLNIDLKAADVNNDGKVDSRDVVKILKKLAGY